MYGQDVRAAGRRGRGRAAAACAADSARRASGQRRAARRRGAASRMAHSLQRRCGTHYTHSLHWTLGLRAHCTRALAAGLGLQLPAAAAPRPAPPAARPAPHRAPPPALIYFYCAALGTLLPAPYGCAAMFVPVHQSAGWHTLVIRNVLLLLRYQEAAELPEFKKTIKMEAMGININCFLFFLRYWSSRWSSGCKFDSRIGYNTDGSIYIHNYYARSIELSRCLRALSGLLLAIMYLRCLR